MADVNDHKPAKSEQHEEAHAELHDEKSTASIPDKHDSNDRSKDAKSSLSDKVSSELTSADWKNLGNQFSKTSGPEARSILSWNPLGDQSEKARDGGWFNKSSSTAVMDRGFSFDSQAKGFSDFLNHGSDKPESWFGDQLKGVARDPFTLGRPVDNLNQMGMPVRDLGGNGVFTPDQLWGSHGLQTSNDSVKFWGESIVDRSSISYDDKGKVSLGESITNSFIKDAMQDQQQNKSLWSGIADGAKSIWNKVAETGSEILDSAKKAGNASIEFVGLGSAIGRHDTPGGKVETTVSAEQTTFSRPGEKITQSAVDKNGIHEHTKVETRDGQSASVDNGVHTLANQNSDIKVQHDPKTGKVEVFDKSGKEISEFNSEGEARHFFETAITQVAKPGQSLDDAYNEYLKSKPKDLDKDHPDHLSKPMLIMDGKGETLVVQPDGSRLYRHPNGDVDATYKHIDRHGNPRDIEVKIRDGQRTIGHKGGRQWDCHSHEANDILKDGDQNSRLRMDDKGNIQVNQDISGDPRRAYWERLMDERNRLHIFRNGELDPRTGQVVVDDRTQHVEFTTNNKTGVVTETDTVRRPDGTLDAHPSSVTTIDPEHAKVTIQGLDPTTGDVKPQDKVVFDEKANTVDAWRMKSTPSDVTLLGPDGDKITIDERGDIHGEDKDGNSFVDTKGDETSYDGGHTYTQEREAYHAQHEEQVTDAAVQAAVIVDSSAAALFARTDISAADVDALDQMLSQAVGNLPPNSPIPPQVSNARATLAALKGRLSNDQSVDQKTISMTGQANGTLRQYAREAGNVGSDAAAQYAIDRFGIKPKSEKDKN